MKQIQSPTPSVASRIPVWLRLAAAAGASAALFFGTTQPHRADAATFTVNSTNNADDGVCDGTHCSLREAINAANAAGGADQINFSITGAGPHIITPVGSGASSLPDITDAVTILGSSEPDWAVGAPVVVLDGTSAGAGESGLEVNSSGAVTIEGLIIKAFPFDGIRLVSGSGHTIQGNRIGHGEGVLGGPGNGADGIDIGDSSSANIIGGPFPSQRNTINSNGGQGIDIGSGGSNVIKGNYIGVRADGVTVAGNSANGIATQNGSSGNVIGGPFSGERNVIAANSFDGISITSGSGNIIKNNYIGTSSVSLIAIPNGEDGIEINTSDGNIIGSTTSGDGNTIAFNTGVGVEINVGASDGNTIRGNSIYSNGGVAIDITSGMAQGSVTPPTISSASFTSVSGGGCGASFCTIDVYSDDANESQTYHASATFPSGGAWTVPGTFGGPNIAATKTDSLGNTSELSATTPTFYQVDSTADSADGALDGICFATTGSVCTLRAAIQEVNFAGGPDIVRVKIGSGLQTLTPATAYPTITVPITIDATTQPGWVAGGGPLIELNGTSAGGATIGLRLTGGNSTIRGLVINRFGGDGIRLETLGGNTLQNNHVGVGPLSSVDLGNGGHGLQILNSPNNLIGGEAALFADYNVFSGNAGDGVFISGVTSSGNTFITNLFGTNAGLADTDVGNDGHGIRILNAPNNLVRFSVLSGNGSSGVTIVGPTASGNTIRENAIGTDRFGVIDLGNSSNGVLITNAPNNQIGLSNLPGGGNVISGNTGYGVGISGATATGNTVRGNLVGLALDGTTPLANGYGVVTESGATGNTIGGFSASDTNVISGNGADGVLIGADDTTVRGNVIGTDVTGLLDRGNGQHGVNATGSGNATVANNVIAGNSRNGVLLSGAAATGTDVYGNKIGVGHGTTALGNSERGVRIESSASGNYIGLGPFSLEGNTIANNTLAGVEVNDAAATGNRIRGNSIHTNTLLGIDLTGGAQGGVLKPDIDGIDNDLVTGTACNFCLVDIYSDDANEGRIYQGLAVADSSGNWIFSGTVAGPNLTATATDVSGNTSEFSDAEPVVYDRIVGDGSPGSGGDGFQAQFAQLNGPHGLFETAQFDLYLADTGNNKIRRISPNEPEGIISTVAGGGTGCGGQLNALGDGCLGIQGILSSPVDVTVAGNGDVYIADTNNCRIRKVSGGVITTVAGDPGNTPVCGYNGDGLATSRLLDQPRGVSVDIVTNDLYIADTENHIIRKLTIATGMLTTIAGTPDVPGFLGEGLAATSGRLDSPHDVAAGNLGLFIADKDNHRVRRVAFGTNIMTTIAGNGTPALSGDGGLGTLASLNGPEAVAVDAQDVVLIADTGNDRIRFVNNTGFIDTLAGGGLLPPPAAALDLLLSAPAGVAAGTVSIANTGAHQIVASDEQQQYDQNQARPATSCSQNPGSVANGDFLMLLAPMGAIAGRRRIGRYLSAIWAAMRPPVFAR